MYSTMVNLDGTNGNKLFEFNLVLLFYHCFHRVLERFTQQELLKNQVLRSFKLNVVKFFTVISETGKC